MTLDKDQKTTKNTTDADKASAGGHAQAPTTGKAPRVARIEVDRDLCIGAESCVLVAPDAFKMDGERKAVVKETWRSLNDDTILTAAKACPTAAIFLYDEDGNQVYP